MPIFRDPIFLARYSWQTRRDSLVNIESRLLPLDEAGGIPLTLKIQRRFLAELLKDDPLETDPETYDGSLLRSIGNDKIIQEEISGWSPPQIRCYFFCMQLAFHLNGLATNPPPRRENKISLSVFPPPINVARLVVLKHSIPVIRKFFASSAPEGGTHIESLTWLIQMFLFTPSVLTRINSPARGREFKKQRFLDLLPGAFFLCHELVIRAKTDEDTREEISKLLAILQTDDDTAKRYLEIRQGDDAWDRFVAPLLVYWGFYGAWKRFKIMPGQTPDDLLRQYLYGENHRRIARDMRRGVQLDQFVLKKVIENAKKLYLRKRGAAAKHFDLV